MSQAQRAPAAIFTSAAVHVIAIGLVLVGVRHSNPSAQESGVVRHRIIDAVVWNGAGGGGGGGNNEPAPARRAESRGSDPMTLQVRPPAPLTAPATSTLANVPPPIAVLDLPVASMALGTAVQFGTPDGVPGGTSLGPGSEGGAGTGRGPGAGPGDGAGLGPGSGGNSGGGLRGPGGRTVQPRLVRDVRPLYTLEAMRARIEGLAVVDCLVTSDGTVTDVRVVRSLDRQFGLDQEAVKAAHQWRFLPGTVNGQPVPMRVRIELTFSLR